jgi:hypothetical protein
MFHVELRQFPNNFCRFNLNDEQLQRMIVGPWSRGEWIELGERKWNPEQAKLTVLEGPEIALNQLTMGRGWRNAQRRCQDATERLLAAAVDTDARGPLAGEEDPKLASDSLGLQLLVELAHQRIPLARLWGLACERYPDRRPSQCLALAEETIVSLAESGLIVLFEKDSEQSEPARIDEEHAVQSALRSAGNWGIRDECTMIWIAKS